MKKSKKSAPKPTTYIVGPLVVTLLICAFLFTTGVVAWNFLSPKPLDIFEVHPLVPTPFPTPSNEETPLISENLVKVEEEVVAPQSAEEFMASDPDVAKGIEASKPNLFTQSLLGWQIILNLVTIPFTK